MNLPLLTVLGMISGVLNLAASIPYFVDIFKGNTKPERATWWIWFMLAAVSFIAQLSAGAKWSLVLAASSVLVAGATALLSIRYGFGSFHLRDALSIIVTIVGILFAYYLKSPLIALVTVLAIDGMAAGLTLYKTWYAPRTENLMAWSISTVAVACGVLSVGTYQIAILISPLSNFVVNVLMVSTILLRQKKVLVQPADV